MDLKEARGRAAEVLKDVCKVCRYCDGVACAGQVPGYGGAGTGTGFMNNYRSLARISINLRVLHDAGQPEIKANLLGIDLSMPIIGAAIAGTRVNRMGTLAEQDLADAMILGAKAAGTISMGGDGGDAEVLEATLASARKAGGHCIPVIKPRMNPEILKRMAWCREAGCTVVGIDVDAAALVNMALTGQKVEPKGKEKLEEIVRESGMKVVLKGIMTPDEARTAVEAGCAGIVVSNHGGRSVDHTPGTADALPAIAKEVKGKIAIIVDGGVRSGVDVLKMLALGADVVMVGRPLAIAGAGGGAEAVALQLKEYASGLEKAMMLTGCPDLASITGDVLYRP
ncbi:MAG TPA: alpha-hydroxy-acid oxidizing protein [Bacillota bacterium]|nr:alpha-hydroxy-acid oxidizing protein [Bacillota bacterium]